MSQKKYHISSGGFYRPCEAEVKPCPRGGHATYTAEEFEAGRQSGDPRFLKPAELPTFEKSSLARNALADFQEAKDNLSRWQAMQQELQELTSSWDMMNPQPGRLLAPEGEQKLRDMYGQRMTEHLVEAGVNPTKARFIVSDAQAKGEWLPPVKKKDKYDADIEAKTTAAREAVEQDVTLAVVRGDLANVGKARRWAADRHKFKSDVKSSLMKKYNVGTSSDPEKAYTEAAERLRTVHQWHKNGVPEEATPVVDVSQIRPNQVALGKDGLISNMWVVSDDGSTDQVVTYMHPRSDYEPGYLLTKGGQKVQHLTHYHSFKKSVHNPVKGATRVLMSPAPADATRFPTTDLGTDVHGRPAFRLRGEIDTSG